MKYKTERIENIEDLQAIHRTLYVRACNLRDEIDKEKPNMHYIKDLVKSIHMESHKAIDFEFFIAQRTINEV